MRVFSEISALIHFLDILIIGLLQAQYTFTNIDIRCLCEKERLIFSGTNSVLVKTVYALVAGFVLLVAITFCIQDRRVIESRGVLNPLLWIFADAVGRKGAAVLAGCIFFAMLFSGYESLFRKMLIL